MKQTFETFGRMVDEDGEAIVSVLSIIIVGLYYVTFRALFWPFRAIARMIP
jgi:hypothetical protein